MKTVKKQTNTKIGKYNSRDGNKEEKEYVIIYQSEEHYEVLGYVKANSLEEAKKKAQVELLEEAKYYEVKEAEIDEIARYDELFFEWK